MQSLSINPSAFIRPSPAAETLGGVTNTTHESILLCEAAGYDVILVETVGVGQSETMVHGLVDFFMLLLLPGAGDDLQGIKRGIVELADMVVVNKVDGDRIAMAKEIKRSYQNAIHLFGAKANQWETKVFLVSALQKEGLDNIWEELIAFDHSLTSNGYKSKNRIQQRKMIFEAMLKNRIWEQVLDEDSNIQTLEVLKEAIQKNDMSIYEAINKFTKS
jgi:LAO/AO transport system kinase